MASTMAEISWLIGWFKKLGMEVDLLVQLLCDAKIQFRLQLIQYFMKEQSIIDCHFVKEKIQEGQIQTQHIDTKDQLADLITKSLCRPQHDYLVSKMGRKNIFYPSI